MWVNGTPNGDSILFQYLLYDLDSDAANLIGVAAGAGGNDNIEGSRSCGYGSYTYGDVLNGDDGNDGVYGNDCEDVITGDNGSDWLEGGTDDDEIRGGQGDDGIDGGPGDDELHGDSEHDTAGPFTGDLDMADARLSLIGEAEGDRVGFRLDGNADVNGDGLADMTVGAENDESAGSGAGAAYVRYGPVSGTIELGAADAKLLGEAGGDSAGSDVGLASDVDGDGLADVLVGAYEEDGGGVSAGSAYLVSGPVSGVRSLADATGKMPGEEKIGWAGWALDGRGDLDEDGFADVVVGAPFLCRAYLLYAPLSGTIALADADVRFLPTSTSDKAGYSVAFVGDLTGDGGADVAIGAVHDHLGAGWAGAVYLFDGG